MPIVTNEIVITTVIEKDNAAANHANADAHALPVGEVVKLAVEKVMDILQEKKQR